jgi:hypothetical protein
LNIIAIVSLLIFCNTFTKIYRIIITLREICSVNIDALINIIIISIGIDHNILISINIIVGINNITIIYVINIVSIAIIIINNNILIISIAYFIIFLNNIY